MKLNLGCGYNKIQGWLNVDKFDTCNPDLVLDLEQTPWPFETNSVEAIYLNHVLEHIGAASDAYLSIMQEIYRVCRGGATVQINVPHPRHDDFIMDPTHVRIVSPQVMSMFSKRENQAWRDVNAANTLLAFYLDVDFEVRTTTITPDPRYQDAINRGELDLAGLMELARDRNNVIREYKMTVEVIKS